MKNCGNHRLKGYSLAALAAAALGFSSFSASALKNDDDMLVEGAKLCTRYLPRHERQFGIPEHLLAAIASTESGRFHKALGMNLPWPWTINVEGTGYFFDSKQEAIDAVETFQSRGHMSIDVGCMQVNLMHHPNAFASLDQAFDPAYNVQYGAQFLRRNFDEEKSWHKATADYHSRTSSYGEPYARLVYGAWGKIINKVADARAGRPILNAAVARSYVARARSYHPMHMHSVSVASDTTREDGVIVVRPQYGSQPSAPVTSVTPSQLNSYDGLVVDNRKPDPASDKIERTALTPNGMPNGIQDIVDKQVVQVKASAPAPALTPAPTQASVQPPVHGAQVIHVHADGSVSLGKGQGQFEPMASAGHAAVADTSSANASSTPKSPFVFNY